MSVSPAKKGRWPRGLVYYLMGWSEKQVRDGSGTWGSEAPRDVKGGSGTRKSDALRGSGRGSGTRRPEALQGAESKVDARDIDSCGVAKVEASQLSVRGKTSRTPGLYIPVRIEGELPKPDGRATEDGSSVRLGEPCSVAGPTSY